MTNALILVFAVFLCLVNAGLWTVYSELPAAGALWIVAAGSCVVMRRWALW